MPAPSGHGLVFITRNEQIPAVLENALEGDRRTTLQKHGVAVATVEHLLAALSAAGIWDAKIQVHGGEVPALDSSAREFLVTLLHASKLAPTTERCVRVLRPFSHRIERSQCHLVPADGPVVECTIDFSHKLIGRQHVRISGNTILDRLIGARTFGLLGDAARLRCQGLGRGASLANTVVFDERRVLNPGGLRYSDEPVRHKVLDALGDLALLGGPFVGRVRLDRPSHRLLQQTLRRAVAAGVLESQTP